ncbi:MAG TPA: lipoyl synthase [Deltaproteobacteria bacterium]|nr:lipoyl synthase [Deltaproteobacteria bacterium]
MEGRGSSSRLPAWVHVRRDHGCLHEMKALLRGCGLSTVCEEARCPNASLCFANKTATFLILGDVCTRACRFCGVAKGVPAPVDPTEPARVARAARMLGLEHVVITSVTRDDLEDKGARAFARTIRAIKDSIPACTVEVLTPDFGGLRDPLSLVLSERPDVFGHNVETVGRLQEKVRPGADLGRSLGLLEAARELAPHTVVKSGFMVGLGERADEIEDLLRSLAGAGCDIVTIGQYLRPSMRQVEVRRYWEPEAFETWAGLAKSLGIGYCVAGPLVRSSFRARETLDDIRTARGSGDRSPTKEKVWRRSG